MTERASLANGEAALCWVARAGRFFYGANAGSALLTGYTIGSGGVPAIVSETPTDAGPIDLAATPDGAFLYVETGGGDIVDGFAVQATARSPSPGEARSHRSFLATRDSRASRSPDRQLGGGVSYWSRSAADHRGCCGVAAVDEPDGGLALIASDRELEIGGQVERAAILEHPAHLPAARRAVRHPLPGALSIAAQYTALFAWPRVSMSDTRMGQRTFRVSATGSAEELELCRNLASEPGGPVQLLEQGRETGWT